MKRPGQYVKQKAEYKRGSPAINVFDPTLSLSTFEPHRLQPGYKHPRTRYERYWVWRFQPAPSSSSQSVPSLVAAPPTLDSTGNRAEKEAGQDPTIAIHSEDVSSPSATKRERFGRTNSLTVILSM